jgi:hypothetical protein
MRSKKISPRQRTERIQTLLGSDKYEKVKPYDVRIKHSPGHKEFDFQAYIWASLRKKGWDVRGEVLVKTPDGNIILDLVVFNSNKIPVRIIEVKTNRGMKKPILVSNQVNQQRRLGLGVDLLAGKKRIKKYIESWPIFGEGKIPDPHFDAIK